MDSEDQRRTQTQGNENHGVHVCNKCGWPFPNPHPSAKQRRSHKKNCGTIEGYKLLNPSDDEHFSDNDQKTQGPKALESGKNEKGIDGLGGESIRSRDEQFLDAIEEWDNSDLATDPEIIHRKHLNFSVPSKENGSNVYSALTIYFTTAEESSLISESRNDIVEQNPKILQSETDDDCNLKKLQDLKTDDSHALTSDSNTSKSEAMSNVFLDNKIYADGAMEATLKEKDEMKPDRNMFEIVVSSDSITGGTFEGISGIAVTEVVNSKSQLTDGAFNLKENHGAAFPSVMAQEDLFLEAGSAQSMNNPIDGIQVESEHMTELATSGDIMISREREEVNVHVLTFPSCDDRPDAAHPPIEYEYHEPVVSQNSASLDSSKALEQEHDDLKDSVTEENDFLINQGQPSKKRDHQDESNRRLHETGNIPKGSLMGTSASDENACDGTGQATAVIIRDNTNHNEGNITSIAVDDECRGNNNGNDTGICINTCQSSNVLSEINPSSICNNEDGVEMSKFEQSDIADTQHAESGIVKDATSPGNFESTILSEIQCSNRSPLSCTQKEIKDEEINSIDRSNEDSNIVASTTDAPHQTQDEEPLLKATEGIDMLIEDSNRIGRDHSLNIEPSNQSVSPVEDTQDGQHDIDKKVPGVVAIPIQDQSGVPVQCDAQATNEAEAIASTDLLVSTETENSDLKCPDAASKEQQYEKSEMFEPPSFMTLVEPGLMVGPKSTPEVETDPNKQRPDSSSSQAAWFPTLTHISNESEGRKRNEEIIAKVTSKQNTPLKSLLVEARNSKKPKSPKSDKDSANQKRVRVAEDNGSGLMTVNSILGCESPAMQIMNRESTEEWNSAADIRREKKKAKNRSHWIQLLCCSSVETR
ncbi:hypothetical protein PIB30_056183 [Stylosanthes scabra]|uniref:Uncharacterized protein n=1 Tax=Stylosanthes scabra TaxID=79078 RepID=A0ABU6TJ61_9FABA|nr:hypothetical protein [Stylosanthes scabra]